MRGGIVAADSWETIHTEDGGARRHTCQKIFTKRLGQGKQRRTVILATAGETYPGMTFVEWFGSGKPKPDVLLNSESDFDILILDRGRIYVADRHCQPVQILEPFYAIGSGAKAALAAMHCGKSAREAVKIAARIDPYTGGRVCTAKVG